MKILLSILLLSSIVFADTPPARVINSETYDASGNPIHSTGTSLNVDVTNSISATVTGTVPVTQSTSPWVVSGNVGRTWNLLNTTDSVNVGNFPSFALDSTLVALSAKFGTLGQKAMSGSAPVVIASDQTSIPVTGTFFQAVQPVSQSGTWTVLATQNTSPWVVSGSGNFTVVQPTGTNLHVVVDSAPTTTVNQGTSPWVTSVSNFPATQAVTQSTSPWVVSGTVTSNIGTTGGLALDTTLSTLSSKFNTLGQKTMANSAPVVIASDQSSIPVTGTFFQAVQPVSQSGTWTVLATQNTSPWVSNISQFGGNNVVTGTGASGLGIPRVTVSNDSNILATQSGTWNINNVSGTVSLPTGAATSANQTNGNQQTQIVQGGNTATVTAASALKVDGSAVTQPVSGTVTANAGTGNFTVVQPTAANLNALVVTTGGATIAADSTVAKLNNAQGSTTSGETGPLIQGAVTTSVPSYTTGQTSPFSLNLRGALRVKQTGQDSALIVRNDYSVNNVTTASYFQLTASTSTEINTLYIFDSSGQDFTLATGASGSEVDQVQISPGGWNMPISLYIASGTRLSIKSQSATASSGILLITGLK